MANKNVRLSDGTNYIFPLGKTVAMSLLASTSITAERNTYQTFNTYESRKMSDFSLLIFCLKASSTDYRQYAIVPRGCFDTTSESIILTTLHGATSETVASVQFKYVSDTQIQARWYSFNSRTGADANGIKIIEMFGVL